MSFPKTAKVKLPTVSLSLCTELFTNPLPFPYNDDQLGLMVPYNDDQLGFTVSYNNEY